MAAGGAPAEALGGKMDSLEAKMDKMLNFLEVKFEEVDRKIEGVGKALNEMGREVTDLKKTSKELETKVESSERERRFQFQAMEETIKRQNLRITNLEDRQRRRNLRLRNLSSDFAKGGKLSDALRQWLAANGIMLQPSDIERAHWVFSGRVSQRQKDMVVAFTFQSIAEKVFRGLRAISDLNQGGKKIICLRDLSQQTLRDRAALRPVTACLYKNGIKFTWIFPAAILVFREGEALKASTVEEGSKLLSRLGITLEEDPTQQEKQTEGATGGGEPRPHSSLSEPTSSRSATPEEQSMREQIERDERMRQLQDELVALRRERKRQARKK